MYALGMLKSPMVSKPIIMNPVDNIDKIVYQKYQTMCMSPEEILAMINPQIIQISNRDLNDQEYPPLEPLQRQALRSDGIYLIYNCFSIYMFIGRHCDPFFIYEIFKVQDH